MSSASGDEVTEQRAIMFLRMVFAQSVYSGAMLAIQLLMCSYCLHVYSKSSTELRRRRRLYIGISFTIFIADTINRLGTLNFNYVLLTEPKSLLEVPKVLAAENKMWYMYLVVWIAHVAIWVGDALLVYRCYIVWAKSQIVALPLVLLYLTSLSINLVHLITDLIGVDLGKGLQTAWVSLSVTIHCLVTILIASKLLRMRSNHSRILQNFDSAVYLSIIGIMVESALPYSLAMILFLVPYEKRNFTDPDWKQWNMAFDAGQLAYDIVTVMAPQLIIWRVTLGHSFAESTKKTTLLSGLKFHRRPAHTLETSDVENTSVDSSAFKSEK